MGAKRITVSEVQKDRIVTMYTKDRKSMQLIGEEMHYGWDRIKAILLERGITIRPTIAQKKAEVPLTKEEKGKKMKARKFQKAEKKVLSGAWS